MASPPPDNDQGRTERVAAEFDLVRAGDADALEALLRRVQPQLERHAARTLGEWLRARTRPSDVLQDAMLDVVRRIGEFEGSTEAAFVRWIERMIETAALQQHRALTAQKRRPPSRLSSLDELARALHPPPNTPSSFVASTESQAQYERALAHLSPDQRQVIQEVIVAGRPVADVAVTMGRNPAAVHALLSRARAALALRLEHVDCARPSPGSSGP